MQEKVLTVSIAAYNVERYIEECLLPFTQDGISDRCEILVIDDGGTDKTWQIAARFEKAYPDTFKVIHKENGGWGSTVNVGISLAHGKYFKQLDGDDYLEPGNLNEFLDVLEKTDADIVFSPFTTFISKSGKVIEVNDLSERFQKETGKEYPLTELDSTVIIQMHHCTFKTSVLRDSGITLLEHAFYADVELVIKALCNSSSVFFAPMTIYYYRVERAGQSMSINGIRKHYKEHETVLFRVAEYLHENNLTGNHALANTRMEAVIGNQYSFFLRLSPNNHHFREVVEFDRQLKEEYPEFYRQKNRKVPLLRKSFFLAYYPLCWCMLLKVYAESLFHIVRF